MGIDRVLAPSDPLVPFDFLTGPFWVRGECLIRSGAGLVVLVRQATN
jgi:hypothetical protein